MKFLNDLKSSARSVFREMLGLPDPAPSNKRSFAGAREGRTLADWSASMVRTTVNNDLRRDLVTLRDRSRNLVNDNDYGKRVINLWRVNVIGPYGFTLKMRVVDPPTTGYPKGVPDRIANLKIEDAWRRWCRPANCSVTGQQSFRAICDLAVQSFARDGEFLVRRVYNQSTFMYQLQILDPDLLDEQNNKVLPNGRKIILGIEYDEWMRPVAYHLRKPKPEVEVYTASFSRDTDRIPATEIFHGFDIQYAAQARGVPMSAPSMVRLKMLSGYEEASLVNARVSAAKMGFFEKDPDAAANQYQGQDIDSAGNKLMNVEPGSMEELPPGVKFAAWAPEYPTAQHDMFVKSELRGIASGQMVAYYNLGNDAEAVNYSSARTMLQIERDWWKYVQQVFVEILLEPVFSDWLEMAIMSGNLALPLSKFDKYDKPYFVGRRWESVDPLKDAQASIMRIGAGLSTRTEELAEQGDDIDDVNQTLAEEKAEEERLNLTLTKSASKSAEPTAAESTDDASDGNDNGNGKSKNQAGGKRKFVGSLKN